MRCCQTVLLIAGKRSAKKSNIVGHGPGGNPTQLGPTPLRWGGVKNCLVISDTDPGSMDCGSGSQ
jgi:hypothetical protein